MYFLCILNHSNHGFWFRSHFAQCPWQNASSCGGRCRFFQVSTFSVFWMLSEVCTQLSLLKVQQNYALIFQIWWALHASSQNPSVPSRECSRNVWGAFCDGSNQEENCDLQSQPKASRAVIDCNDSMTTLGCKIYFECGWNSILAAKADRLLIFLYDSNLQNKISKYWKI